MSTTTREESVNILDDLWIKNPVLFYGPRKAGTTLLQNLLDGGNCLLMRQGELKLKHFINEIWSNEEQATERYYRKKRQHGVRVRGDQGFKNFDNDLFETEIHKKLRSNTSLKELIIDEIELIYDSIQDKPNDLKYWGVKEAGGDIHQILQLWKQHFFSGKAIFIFREPLMIVRSILNQSKRKNEPVPLRRIHKEVKTALYSLKRMERYLNTNYVHALTYESLTENTEKEVKSICRFLQIDYEQNLTYPTKFGVKEKVGNASKNTHKVFKNSNKWYSGLTMKEKIAVGLFYFIYKHRIRFSYNDVANKINK